MSTTTYLLIALREHGLKILHGGQTQIKLIPVVLREGSKPQIVMSEDVAFGRTELVEDEVEESGLAGTVNADDTWRGREGGRKGGSGSEYEDEDVAFGRTELVEDEVEESGLAGTVGADDTCVK